MTDLAGPFKTSKKDLLKHDLYSTLTSECYGMVVIPHGTIIVVHNDTVIFDAKGR